MNNPTPTVRQRNDCDEGTVLERGDDSQPTLLADLLEEALADLVAGR